MKRPTMLVQALLEQSSIDLDLSVERDKRVIAHRCEHEGLSFLTITLPLLCSALEQGIESGTFNCPTSFSRQQSLPRFLGGFFKRVFASDGRLLPTPCPYAIKSLRQILRFMKKLKISCSPDREADAIRHFVEVEGDLRMATAQVERQDSFLDAISRILWSEVFPAIDPLELVCRHGPGHTAERLSANKRFNISNWNERSEATFPSDLHCYPNYWVAMEHSGLSDVESKLRFLPIREEIPVRVVFVPKTQSAPRVIAIEPSHMQYMQQSVMDYVYKALETHRLTKHSLRFTRQDVNQRLAYESSIDRRLATLDLKDASDRVHLHLVQRIFKNSELLPYLEDSRSLSATLPDGTNIVLTKFASMGSALCFPVEAMVFYTIILAAMHALDGSRPSSRSIRRYSELISIYGDDIIIPVEYTDCVVRHLESYALKVNINKSFRFSHFRESCGADYYDGIPVKPVYASHIPHDDARNWGPTEIMSWIATADQFYLDGQWHICQVIRDMVSRVMRRAIPRTRSLGAGVAHFSLLFTTDLYYHRDWQCWRQKRVQFQPTLKKDEIDGDEIACLNKWHLKSLELSTYRDLIHSSRTLLPEIRRRMVSVSEANGSSILEDQLSDTHSGNLSLQHLPEELSTDGLAHLVPERLEEGYGVRDYSDGTRHGIARTALDIKAEQANFHASVKRGGFKSKHRWTSLHS